MAIISHNSAQPARFSVFLCTRKNLLSSGLAKELRAYLNEYARLHAERLKFTCTEAEAHIRSVKALAEDNPSTENIAAIATLDSDGVRRRFEETSAAISAAFYKSMQRARPMLARVRDEIMPTVNSEIAEIESRGHELAAKYGTTYLPDNDGLLNSIKKWREVTARGLGEDNPNGLHPDQIENIVGPGR